MLETIRFKGWNQQFHALKQSKEKGVAEKND